MASSITTEKKASKTSKGKDEGKKFRIPSAAEAAKAVVGNREKFVSQQADQKVHWQKASEAYFAHVMEVSMDKLKEIMSKKDDGKTNARTLVVNITKDVMDFSFTEGDKTTKWGKAHHGKFLPGKGPHGTTRLDDSMYTKNGIEKGFITAQKELAKSGYALIDASDEEKGDGVFIHLVLPQIVDGKAYLNDYMKNITSKWHGLGVLPKDVVIEDKGKPLQYYHPVKPAVAEEEEEDEEDDEEDEGDDQDVRVRDE
jgi:hypothetical protein